MVCFGRTAPKTHHRNIFDRTLVYLHYHISGYNLIELPKYFGGFFFVKCGNPPFTVNKRNDLWKFLE